ncbi:MAG: ExbD/TolR family protein, partial [Steroidobacteraceae bacterium]
DVMLVLLIIFMITAPLLSQGIKVDLPKADAAPLDADFLRDHQPLVLTVDAAGHFFLNLGSNKETPIDARTVIARAAAVMRRDPQAPVLVRADENVPYGRVVSAMVLLQKAGAEKVGFLTDPPESLDAARP